jgi:cyanophycin synthetase
MKTKTSSFSRSATCAGPNIWTYRPVIEAIVDIGELEDFPSNTIPALYERLTGFLPSLIEHRCSYGEARRLPAPARRRHLAGAHPRTCHARTAEPRRHARRFRQGARNLERGVYKVVVRAWHEEVTRACLEAGRELLWPPSRTALSMSPATSRAWLTWPTQAARAEHRLHRRGGNGQGPPHSGHPSAGHRQPRATRLRRPQPAHLDRRNRPHQRHRRGHLARQGSDQDLLKSCGVPVPEGRLVDSAEDAWEAAEDIGCRWSSSPPTATTRAACSPI